MSSSRTSVSASVSVSVLLMCSAAEAVPVPDFGSAGVDFSPTREPNMNGECVKADTPGAEPGKMPAQYRDYPGGVEFYDVYSPPITTYYSQVWWSPLDPVALPDELVKKYAGKGMAIVGWEIDQVRRTPEGDISVPITASYNHHYNAQLIGAGSRFKKIWLSGPDDPRAVELRKSSPHGSIAYDQPHFIVEPVAGAGESSSGAPNHVFAASGNGGEYRKTCHGWAPGYAIVVDSPTALQITPMQIDTWNRDEMNISGPLPPKFVPGPLPRASEAPDGAVYSGLLECPMTTRITKVIDGTYAVQSGGSNCGEDILTFQECYHAAATALNAGGAGLSFTNATVDDPLLPAGCSASTTPSSLDVNVIFNKATTSTVPCASGATSLFGVSDSLVKVTVALDVESDVATISLTGPTDVWFGVGFGAQAMADQPWTLVVDGQGAVSEHQIGGPQPNSHVVGKELKASVKVVSSSTSGSQRTMTVSRALEGSGPQYYTFNATATDPSVPFIAAVGSGPVLAYHKQKTPGKLTLLPTQTNANANNTLVGACVCPQQPAPFGQSSGSLMYTAQNQSIDVGTGSVAFRKQKCKPYPATVLNEQKNPTCDIRYYRGGQWSCHHMWSLLDADQEIPWADQPLVFHHKWRLWVQPYNSSYHQQVQYGFQGSLLIGSPYEYDVPPCADGVPGCALVNGTWIHTITGGTMGQGRYAMLNFHCHAPTCLSMSVYACEKGTALEHCNATVGKLLCEERPVYGGSGNPALNGTRFDEEGYVAIPDCFWGSSEQGLETPPDLTGVPLHMVKTANATWAHYGEMAGGQPWVF